MIERRIIASTTMGSVDRSRLSSQWFYCLRAWASTIYCHRRGGSTRHLDHLDLDWSAAPSASHCRKSFPSSARQRSLGRRHRRSSFDCHRQRSISMRAARPSILHVQLPPHQPETWPAGAGPETAKHKARPQEIVSSEACVVVIMASFHIARSLNEIISPYLIELITRQE